MCKYLKVDVSGDDGRSLGETPSPGTRSLQEKLKEIQEAGEERDRHDRGAARREAGEVARQVADATAAASK